MLPYYRPLVQSQARFIAYVTLLSPSGAIPDKIYSPLLFIRASQAGFVTSSLLAGSSLSAEDLELRFHSVVIKPSSTVRDLGVWLDCELTMHDHILRTSSTCFCHLRKLRQLRGVVSQIAMQRLMSAFVLSRLDCCNAALAGLPSYSLAPLQRVLYAAVRLVTGHGPRDHIAGTMMELHWLPIEHRIKFKLCMIMHAAVSVQCPDYIRGAITPLARLPGRNRLRAAAHGLYDVPRTRTMFGQRAFSVAGPRQWNDLPSDIRKTTDRAAFKRALKSHFLTRLWC